MLGAGPTGFQWITLAVAAVGAASGLAALAWRAFEFKWSGPRVRVELALGIGDPTGAGGQWLMIVEATNGGRSAVEVTGWGILLPDDRQIVAW